MIAGDSTVKLIQANARVPEDGRPVLLKAAALMRADPSFTVKLEAFLCGGAGDEPGSLWHDRLADMTARIEALEAVVGHGGNAQPQAVKAKPEGVQHDPDTPDMFGGDASAYVANASNAPEMDWQARAAAIVTSTGEGRQRRLTPAGAALFDEMAQAGCRVAEIMRALDMKDQSVRDRLKKMKGQGDGE